MELTQVVEQRVSVRSYKDQEVSVELLKEIARMGSLAPSVNNYQPWKFVAVTNKEILHKMAVEVHDRIEALPDSETESSKNIKSQVEWFATFFEDAPSVIAVAIEDYESVLEQGVDLTHKDINKMRNYPDIQSAGACIQNMLLAATDKGLGACWMSAPLIASKSLSEILKLDDKYKLIAIVAVGYPKGDVKPKAKKEIDNMFTLMK
ncbi:MAG: nitroreductase family protein [Bacteroidales bacterium]|jgi:nitroreductase|nr:nitroreductase family protein [Bacteroidales bacterium]